MEDLKLRLLQYISSHSGASEAETASALRMPQEDLRSLTDRMEHEGLVSVKRERLLHADVTEEGRHYMGRFPEEALRDELAEGARKLGEIHNSIALGWAKKNGWIVISDGTVTLTERGAESAKAEYPMRELLIVLVAAPAQRHDSLIRNRMEVANALAKRKLISIAEEGAVSGIYLTEAGEAAAGRESSTGEGKLIGQLSKELLLSKGWKGRGFKSYDVNAPSETLYPARMHPVHEFLSHIRRLWTNMGFTEIEGPIVESAFWNFDALFSPQDHPTRDMQDTFFLSNPKVIGIEETELLAKIRSMHEKGWKAKWDETLARQPVLRTHNTSVSARHIRRFAKYDDSEPLRLFSVGKVFRNESIDYKHLAELHQSDGIVIGRKLSLANLKHTLSEFYSQLGMDVRFRPSYFPFVEPGMEVKYFDKEHDDWIELCGAGVIRREITEALGNKNRVLAWGMGLDRLLFNALKLGSLSDLYRNDVDWLRTRGKLSVH